MLLKSSLNLCIVFLEIFSTLCKRFYNNVSKSGRMWQIIFSTTFFFFQMCCCSLNFLYSLCQIHFSPNVHPVLLHFRKEEKEEKHDGHLIKSEFTAVNKSSYLQIQITTDIRNTNKVIQDILLLFLKRCFMADHNFLRAMGKTLQVMLVAPQ